MNISEWMQLLGRQIVETEWLQWLAVALAVTEVLLARVNNVMLYPAGLGSTALSVYILFHAGLYAESLLNMYYVVMSIYGWWLWIKKKHRPALPVTFATRTEWRTVIMMTALLFGLLSVLLQAFTPSTVPYADAWVTATAWMGMWLLARRKVENWIMLNISNAFAIPLLIHKDLPLYALLTLFLFIVAINGYFKWRRIAQENSVNGYSISH